MKTTKAKRREYAKFILRLLAGGAALYAGGLLYPSRAMPLLKAFQRFSSQELAALRRAIRRLERQRLIELSEKSGDVMMRLTDRGAARAIYLRADELTLQKPARWDGKWRLVLFDIPEYLRAGRDALRDVLIRLGFYQVQKSAFMYPFPCEKEIEGLANAFGFENCVHCFHVAIPKNSYEKHLRKLFGI